MASNRGVVYMKPGVVEIHSIDFPKLEDPTTGKTIEHGVLLKIVSTNICGSDQHMVRGRTTAPAGLVLGHEITGEVIETGRDVLFIKKGDLVSVPFNIACGRCRNCKEGKTGICLNVNKSRPGAAYGYVDMGGWVGGQAEYVMVPYADFNLLKFPDRDKAMAKIRDLTLLSDIFPTGYHGAVTAGVGTGSTVYVAGAGPVGLASAAACHLLGAAVVIVGDMIPERLQQAKSFGCETVDLARDAGLADQIEQILGVPEVDCAVDCVGFEARGHGHDAKLERPATVLNSIMSDHPRRRCLGHPGALRDRRSRRGRRQRQDRHARHSHRPGLGQESHLLHGPMSRDEVQPRVDDGHLARQDRDRQGGQRYHDLAGPGGEGLSGLRQGRCEEIRHRPARPDCCVSG